MKRDQHDIARLQRKKEQFEVGSAARQQVVKALCQAYQRATHRRTNFAHQQSRKLVNAYQLMVFEDLDIQEMQSDGQTVLNRSIADVAWTQFTDYVVYKAERAGRTVVFVNPSNTAQMCSCCGHFVPKALNMRIHDCPHCGLKLDRDLNAALNILALGLQSIGADTSVTRRSPRVDAGE
jgi:putative transposase